MRANPVVSPEDWLAARKRLLAREKEFTRLRDELSRERRELPWEKVEKEYVFETPAGKKTLADLFGSRSQLLVYHFMFGPDWEAGCKSCSFWADNFNGIVVHLEQRDVAMLAASRAPLAKLEAFKGRMGWSFKWVSSLGNTFNHDYRVSFPKGETPESERIYNYQPSTFSGEEAPGISVFYKDEQGRVFHTYSCYARGLDMLNGAYHYLDLVPKGRGEEGLSFSMEWVRHHDRYEGDTRGSS
jgi:predicted dithiol-disulfide oxidoreductase (DUF899 family)